MMSGRGLGHTTGTLDKLDAIPGFRTDLSLDEFRSILDRVGCAMMGQTREIAPLDRKLYALRDVTGTVPAIPLIAASIMSKKLAEGLDGLLLDVKVGAGAFLPAEEDARELARTMVEVGAARGLDTVALLTAMDRPLGRAVGNGLETAEAVRCLRGDGPADLRALVVAEVAEMLLCGGVADDRAGARARVGEALDSGAGLDRFVRLLEAQGGDAGVADDPGRLPRATEERVVEAEAAGTVAGVDPRALGEGVVALGGGRRRMSDDIDLAVGFELAVAVGDEVAVGDPLGTVHARDEDGARKGARILSSAVRIGSGEGIELRPLVSHRVSREGVETYDGG
jgi:pyrimidine-nucleoside phosphorylase